MSSRSLSRIFALQDRAIGANTKIGGNEKLIKSPNNNKRFVVPGHISDMEFQNDRNVVEPNVDRLTDSNANWNRFNIRRIKSRDRTHAAVADYDVVPREVRRG